MREPAAKSTRSGVHRSGARSTFVPGGTAARTRARARRSLRTADRPGARRSRRCAGLPPKRRCQNSWLRIVRGGGGGARARQGGPAGAAPAGAGRGVPSASAKSDPITILVPSTRKRFGVAAPVRTTLRVALAAGPDEHLPARRQRGDPVERRGLRAEIVEVRRRPREVGDVAVAHVLPDVHEARGRPIRQRREEHRIHDAEDRGCGADAKRQRRDRGDRKRRFLVERPDRVGHVGDEGLACGNDIHHESVRFA